MTTTAPADSLRHAYVRHLADTGALHSPGWRSAFATVPRETFTPRFAIRTREGMHAYTAAAPDWLSAVYSDDSLLTAFDHTGTAISSSSQPSVMARMLELLDLADGDRVLEVGTGTGYNAALLCERLGSGRVVTVDIDPHLTAEATGRLSAAGYTPTVVTGDGRNGWPTAGPYDAVIATCGIPRIPAAWLDQVRPGGRIVANLGLGLITLTRDADGSAAGRFEDTTAAFMTARSTATAPAPGGRAWQAINTPAAHQRHHGLDIDLGDLSPQFLGLLLQPEVETGSATGSGDPVHLYRDPGSGSWARVQGNRVEWDGPRDLWAELEPLLADCVALGRPGLEQFGLRVGPDGSHVLSAAGREWMLP